MFLSKTHYPLLNTVTIDFKVENNTTEQAHISKPTDVELAVVVLDSRDPITGTPGPLNVGRSFPLFSWLQNT